MAAYWMDRRTHSHLDASLLHLGVGRTWDLLIDRAIVRPGSSPRDGRGTNGVPSFFSLSKVEAGRKSYLLLWPPPPFPLVFPVLGVFSVLTLFLY